ncbi:peptidoglycan recognition protein family protein [Phytoactinopolyspora mesophila]|uniref:N-acetylmuramoyl-L-alanine amidase n=1 Tax=Phytoactinopolyspora mesophila TaxID=2650750 RepID=A0A7K3LXI3_9ACTN|nr:N-acetylmuramoyl-L-alanine amidase [Phytoactinopolyspora mesophila]NDL55695.1 N-acetylmuramoyl-L-alanine amidase [Phytoactinopolyspora mesophila]
MSAEHQSASELRPYLTRRSVLRLALGAPVAAGLITLPSTVQASPAGARIERIAVGRGKLRAVGRAEHLRDLGSTDSPARRSAAVDIYATKQFRTESFSGAALTWAGDAPSTATLLLRTRNRGGGWSEWTTLHDDGHGPDPNSPEASHARRGTDFVIAGRSDAVEVRIEVPAGAIPEDLSIELIDPGHSEADAAAEAMSAGGVETAAARPTIRSRANWGADESIRGSATYGQVRGAFVHHTAGRNGYSQSEVPGIIRSIYTYHVNGRGWKDIGYNFLIDRFGRIWEGRHGGVTRAVIGAHTAGYNSYAFGTALLGSYGGTNPSNAALNAFADVIAWKFSVHNVDPRRVSYPPSLTQQPAIAGHRDASATECPGARLYGNLSTIRGRVANRLG